MTTLRSTVDIEYNGEKRTAYWKVEKDGFVTVSFNGHYKSAKPIGNAFSATAGILFRELLDDLKS